MSGRGDLEGRGPACERRSLRTDVLRFAVFFVWFGDLVYLLLGLGVSGFGQTVNPSIGDVVRSGLLMLGLVTPTFGAMTIFYMRFDPAQSQIVTKSVEQVAAIILCSLLYHAVFLWLIYRGIWCQDLASGALGSQLYANCTVIATVMGPLAFLLAPAAWLLSGHTPSGLSRREGDGADQPAVPKPPKPPTKRRRT